MEIADFFASCGFETIILAVCTNILTCFLKIPIKILSKKLKDKNQLTRFITFFPIILGLAVVLIYKYICEKTITFNDELFRLWISTASMSLALYAILEKFFPNSNTVISKEELQENKELLDSLKTQLITNDDAQAKDEKIVLKGNKDVTITKK